MQRNIFCLCFFSFMLSGKTIIAQPLQLLQQNPHYFLYHGKPLVIVGSGEHYGAVLNKAFDYVTYLHTLKKDGLNTTRLFMGAYFEKPGAFGIQKNTLAPDNDNLLLPWQKENGKYNLAKWNPAYFQRLHNFMKEADEAGVIVEVNLFSAYYNSGWSYHPFNEANNVNSTTKNIAAEKVNTPDNGNILQYQEAYTRKIVSELNGYDNFYFEIQNEPYADAGKTVYTWNDYLDKRDLRNEGDAWKKSVDIASDASAAWQIKVASWITGEEAKLNKKHLISQNICNFLTAVKEDNPGISIYNFHYALSAAASLNYGLNKVIGFNETGFAGSSDDVYRKQAWRFMMSGGGLFGHLDYSFSTGHEDGTDTNYNAPGGGSAALRKSFRVLKNFMEQCDLKTLHPDDSFVIHAAGAFAYSMRDEKSCIVYLEPAADAAMELTLQIPAGSYTGEWTDTKTGSIIKTEEMVFANDAKKIAVPAVNAEVVLKLKK